MANYSNTSHFIIKRGGKVTMQLPILTLMGTPLAPTLGHGIRSRLPLASTRHWAVFWYCWGHQTMNLDTQQLLAWPMITLPFLPPVPLLNTLSQNLVTSALISEGWNDQTSIADQDLDPCWAFWDESTCRALSETWWQWQLQGQQD